jgi:intermembrane space import and assembly protein 40
MAKGPCGEEFKTAFSCFVFSEAEPKGSDCISAFQAMQTCFQEFPEYYSDQLRDDDKKVTGNNDDSDAAAEHNSTYDSQETVSTPDNINVQNESLDNTITSTSTPAVL